MATQHGLITRPQALDAGLSPKQVRQLVAGGQWVAVRRGVYVDHDAWEELDRWTGRPRLGSLAAGLATSTPHVFSHDSAADLLGLPIVRGRPELVHMTQPGHIGQHTAYGIKHHVAPYEEHQVVEACGVRCLDLARTAADIGREHGFRFGLAAADGALRMGVPRRRLHEAVAPMRHWTGVDNARLAARLADGGAANVAESLMRGVILGLGIGEPETQFELSDGERWVSCDVRVGRHVFEFDGRLKYLPPEAGGVTPDPDRSPWEEKLRQDWLHRHRLGASRVIWNDLWGVGLRRLPHRLLAEYRETEARWGTSVDDLAHLIVVRRPA